jgi:hypothetical protein
LDIPDDVPPVIYSMYVYRLNNKPFNEFTPKQYFQVSGGAGNYRLNSVSTINLSGEVGFGIVTTDRHSGASGLNGVYSIELLVDGSPVYTSALEKFSFGNSKAINSHIDYPTYLTTKRSIQKSFVDPGNPLRIYSNLVNNGRVAFTDGNIHDIEYVVTDGKGNKSRLKFKVKGDAKAIVPEPAKAGDIPFTYATANEFNNDKVKVMVPKGTLYNDMNFVYKTLPKPQTNAYSAIHQIHNNLTPLHIGFELWIKADSSLLPFKDKAVIVNTGRASQGGYFEDGYVKAKPRNFGSFFIAIDTTAPTITPVNISNGKSMGGISKMSFKIRDNLSGIKSFNGYIDGRWVLMEFDAKTASLWHSFDETTSKGKHTFKLVVTDMKENTRDYSITFYK